MSRARNSKPGREPRAPAPAAPAAARARPEAWTRAAAGVALAAAGWILYLGSRLPGRAPMVAYLAGPFALSGVALGLLAFGAWRSARRRDPALRRSRLVACALLAAVIGGTNVPFPFPSRHELHPASVPFELPVEGEWAVIWGGTSPQTNLLARAAPDRRFGLVLTRVVDGATHAGSGSALEDFHAFGEPVLAAAAGLVVRAVDGRADRAPGEPFERGAGASDALGNHVVLEVAPETFLFTAHLARGSLEVELGERVAAGQRLGRVGRSGRDPYFDEPHVAVHLQDTPVPHWGQAIPWRFADYVADGARVDTGEPLGGATAGRAWSGQRVRRAGAAERAENRGQAR